MTSLKDKAKAGLIWSAIERFSTQFIQLAVMLVLARLLGPEAFGLIGMLAVFIALSQTVVDSGMREALIRTVTPTAEDCATVFYFNIGISIGLYGLLFVSSPAIASFYNQPELTSLMRVLGLVVIINSFMVIQQALLSIKMDFKTLAKASLLAVLVSSVIALTLAYLSFGVWALVGQTLSYAFLQVTFLNVLHRWRPQASFSKESFNRLFGFGSKLLLSSMLDTFYQNIYQLIIGKQFNSTQVGFFTQARNLTRIPAATMTSVIQRVTYPMLSAIQHDVPRLERSYLKIMQLAALVIFPLFFGLAVVADDFIPLLLGEEWRASAALVAIIAFGTALYPIHSINLNFLKVKGRSDLFLKLEVIKKIIITLVLFITVPLGVEAICIGMVSTSYFALIINTYYNGKLSSLGLLTQLKALLPIWILSLASCLAAKLLAVQITEQAEWRLLITIFVAIACYVLSVRFTQAELFAFMQSMIKRKSVKPSAS